MTDKDRDLVEELLTRAHPSNVDVTDRAAARIQTLSAENKRLRGALAEHGGRYWEARYRDEAVENERLREALREVFEEWAGSEGFIPETAPEGYLLQLTKRMADTARAALGEK